MNSLSLEQDWFKTSLPVSIDLLESSLEIVQVLRFFPNKRLTCLAHYEGKPVLFKYFGSFELYRHEKKAYDRLLSSGLAVPRMINHHSSEQHWIMYEYISGASSWTALNDSQRIRAIERITEAFALMHAKGFFHEDPHLDNFLICEESIFLVDVAAIQPRTFYKSFLGNYMYFLSQVYSDIKSSWSYFLGLYLRCQNQTSTSLTTYVAGKWLSYYHRRRKIAILKKYFVRALSL